MTTIIRGQKTKLSDLTPALRLQIDIAVRFPSEMAVDICCFGVNAQGKLVDDRYMVFYNQRSSPNGEIVQLGTIGPGIENFQLYLDRLPPTVQRLVFTATIDGNGTMAQIQPSHFRLSDQTGEIARFNFRGSDFQGEKAILIAELYLKDIWRFSATGQGFNGGLPALLHYFGGTELAQDTAPPPVPQKISLAKKIEKDAPHLVDLAKKAAISLEKKKLNDITARVGLVLDASGSMTGQYNNGRVQEIVDRILPLAVHFDDDGALDCWAFAEKSTGLTEVTTKNVKGYIAREGGGWLKWNVGARFNCEPKAIRQVIDKYSSSPSMIPAYIIFISDGEVGEAKEIEQLIIESAKKPIFWQFVGIGGSNYGILERLDSIKGRYIDNCNFFAIDDLHSISDQELYDRLLNEFPSWLKEAKSKRMIA